MTITTSLEPATTTAMPGTTVPLALRLHNAEFTAQTVTVRPTGSLADYTVVEPALFELAPDESVDVSYSVTLPVSLPPGLHSSVILVSVGDLEVATAEATVEVVAVAAHAALIGPPRSKSASNGRHRITIQNRGNLAVDVTVVAMTDDPTIQLQPEMSHLSVEAGTSTFVDITAIPNEKFWNGPPVEHGFMIATIGSDGQSYDLHGIFEQRPRLRPWWGPALAGAAVALLIGTILWFAVLAPYVRSTAEDANAEDRAALDAKIAQLEASAAEAEELPLGDPADLRLSVEAAEGQSSTDTFRVPASTVWSATDIIFQNPTGAAGEVTLMRDDDILLIEELANFRDLDFNLVAPFVFEGDSNITMSVTCDAPGPSESSCSVSTTLTGFVDESS
jgi:hypothetical protein